MNTSSKNQTVVIDDRKNCAFCFDSFRAACRNLDLPRTTAQRNLNSGLRINGRYRLYSLVRDYS